MLEERLEELLSLSIGEIREMLAHEDAEDTLEKFLNDNGWIETDDSYDDDYEEDYDDEDDDWDFDEDRDSEKDDDWDDEDDDEDVPGQYNLPDTEQERLAEQIADDIDAGRYTINDIMGIYGLEFVDRVNYLIG